MMAYRLFEEPLASITRSRVIQLYQSIANDINGAPIVNFLCIDKQFEIISYTYYCNETKEKKKE